MAHSAPLDPDAHPDGCLSALQSREFRSFWVASLASQSSGWMAQVATSWLLLEMTNSAFYLGLQGLFLSIPFIVSSLMAGAVADRMDRKRLLVITQTGLFTVALTLAIMVYLGVIQVWHIYLLSALSWICAGFESAARQSLVPNLVARHQVPSAIALFSTLHRTTALIGPALGGLAIAWWGVAGALFADAGGFAILVVTVMMMRTTPNPSAGRGPLLRAVLDGFAYARTHRKIGAMLIIQAATSVLVNSGALLPIYARDILKIGPEGYGFLVSAVGAGSITGMLLVIWLGHVGSRARWMLYGSLAYPLLLMGFSISTVMPVSLLMLFACGLADMTVSTMRQTLLQLSVEDSYRGRVMSLQSISARGVSPLGNLQNGTVASLIGAPPALLLSSALALVLILAVWKRTPELSTVETAAVASTSSTA